MYGCMVVCMYVCVCMYLCVFMYVRVYVCMYVCVCMFVCNVCMYICRQGQVCMYVWLYGCKYVSMYVCMHACMYVYMYAYSHIYIYIYTHICLRVARPMKYKRACKNEGRRLSQRWNTKSVVVLASCSLRRGELLPLPELRVLLPRRGREGACHMFDIYIYIYIYIHTYIHKPPQGRQEVWGLLFFLVAWAAISVSQF